MIWQVFFANCIIITEGEYQCQARLLTAKNWRRFDLDKTRNLLSRNELWYTSAEQQDSDVMTEDELDTKVGDLRRALAERREAVGLTTREVARRTGMTNQNVSYLENHSTLTAIKDLIRLAEAYDVELPDLAEAFRGSNDHTADEEESAEKEPCLPSIRPYSLD